MRILPIVEGDGDLAAVPELIRRIAHDHEVFDLQIIRPHKRGDLPKVRARFADYLNTALLEQAPILWVLDYDCETCSDVTRDTADLRTRAVNLNAGNNIEFVFMVQEYETLFLADHETTKAVFPDIPVDLSFPDDPERIRDAKGWISQARPKGSAYKPTTHQARLSSQVDLHRLRARSPSFVRFEDAVLRLLNLPKRCKRLGA